MKRIQFMLLVTAVALFAVKICASQDIQKTFADKDEIRIKLVLGDCKISPSKDGKIHVTVHHTYDNKEFEALMSERSDEIRLEEKLYHPEGGGSEWTLMVPEGKEIDFETATGNLYVEGINVELDANTGTGDIKLTSVSGEFDVNTGTGRVELKDSKGDFELNSGTGRVVIEACSGEFDANSGTGDVEVDKVTIEGSSEFNSGTGDVEVRRPEGTDFSVTIASGTNDAVLDMAGMPLEGYFEMTAHAHKGKIICPVKFDRDDDYRENGSTYIQRSFTRGNDKRRFSIETGTGRAVLKE